MFALRTERLDLIPLSTEQLRLCRAQPTRLELELGFPISRAMITERVQHAIGMKLARMADVEAGKLVWYTYWMIAVRSIPFGAGLAGFKGFPGPNGEAEIGYGLDPAHQKRGYMTEAVQRMVEWAFEEKACGSIVAISVARSNIASQRVLAKVGMALYEETEATLSYRLARVPPE